MPLHNIELPQLQIKLIASAHIGSGYAQGLINRTVVKSRDGLVYIPGSVLKGKVRSACEALAELSGFPACRAPHPHWMDSSQEDCIVCAIFGAPGKGSRLLWRPAYLEQDWALALHPVKSSEAIFGQTTTRTQVKLSRRRGLAAEAHLFTSELAAENLSFQAQPGFYGQLQLTPLSLAIEKDVYYELILLAGGLKMLHAIGGGKSRGLGAIQVGLGEYIIVDGQQISIKNQLENIEYLDREFYFEDREKEGSYGSKAA